MGCLGLRFRTCWLQHTMWITPFRGFQWNKNKQFVQCDVHCTMGCFFTAICALAVETYCNLGHNASIIASAMPRDRLWGRWKVGESSVFQKVGQKKGQTWFSVLKMFVWLIFDLLAGFPNKDTFFTYFSCVFPVEPQSPNGKNMNLHKKWGFRRFQTDTFCVKSAQQGFRTFGHSFWNRRNPHFLCRLMFLPFGLWGSTGNTQYFSRRQDPSPPLGRPKFRPWS